MPFTLIDMRGDNGIARRVSLVGASMAYFLGEACASVVLSAVLTPRDRLIMASQLCPRPRAEFASQYEVATGEPDEHGGAAMAHQDQAPRLPVCFDARNHSLLDALGIIARRSGGLNGLWRGVVPLGVLGALTSHSFVGRVHQLIYAAMRDPLATRGVALAPLARAGEAVLIVSLASVAWTAALLPAQIVTARYCMRDALPDTARRPRHVPKCASDFASEARAVLGSGDTAIMFRGLPILAARDVLGTALDAAAQLAVGDGGSMVLRMGVALTATLASAVLFRAAETVVVRLWLQDARSGDAGRAPGADAIGVRPVTPYASEWDCARRIAREEGLQVLLVTDRFGATALALDCVRAVLAQV